ncbi:4096_t:CDS:2 [Funneliformis geosporum]|uniref:4096_t:CDS:1 n=1 Tax=Funneliformis geosporum TaxID=1117311 RepID=A0A9W4STC7_9GLOM|nr:4096_t:CDS:2 [Funneliformis geosporum]
MRICVIIVKNQGRTFTVPPGVLMRVTLGKETVSGISTKASLKFYSCSFSEMEKKNVHSRPYTVRQV